MEAYYSVLLTLAVSGVLIVVNHWSVRTEGFLFLYVLMALCTLGAMYIFWKVAIGGQSLTQALFEDRDSSRASPVKRWGAYCGAIVASGIGLGLPPVAAQKALGDLGGWSNPAAVVIAAILLAPVLYPVCGLLYQLYSSYTELQALFEMSRPVSRQNWVSTQRRVLPNSVATMVRSMGSRAFRPGVVTS